MTATMTTTTLQRQSGDPLLDALRTIHGNANDQPPPAPPHARNWLFIASEPKPSESKPLPIRKITAMVAREFAIPVQALRSASRSVDVVRPRQVVMYLAKRVAGASLPAIGRALGDRDHTTVLHGVKRIEQLLSDGDSELQQRVERVWRQICH